MMTLKEPNLLLENHISFKHAVSRTEFTIKVFVGNDTLLK